MTRPARVVVGAEAGALRRRLRAGDWVVLEELALAADVAGDGSLVAHTSAAVVAERLGVTGGAAAKALARPRAAGLVEHTREPGTAGRFGRSAYRLRLPPGLSVRIDGDSPDAASPHVERPSVVAPAVARPLEASPSVVSPNGYGGVLDDSRSRRRAAASPSAGQPDTDLPARAAAPQLSFLDTDPATTTDSVT